MFLVEKQGEIFLSRTLECCILYIRLHVRKYNEQIERKEKDGI